MAVYVSSSVLFAVVLSTPAAAQGTFDRPTGTQLAILHDSGEIENTTGEFRRVGGFDVSLEGAAWLRLHFDLVNLPRGGFIRVTSVADNEFQDLDADSLAMWNFSSAYFNGGAVIVDLFAAPNSIGNRASIKRCAAGFAEVAPPGTGVHEGLIESGSPGRCGICGNDDRTLSTQRWTGRLLPAGCTASVYSPAGRGVITAGHCLANAPDQVIQFNVPASNTTCTLKHPPVADQFPIPNATMLYQSDGVGADWGVCLTGVNSLGQTPYERYGVFRPIAAQPASLGSATTFFGYGVDVTCARSQMQQLSFGNVLAVSSTTYEFNDDVRGGDSGSAHLFDHAIIGVVTHCSARGCSNKGTRIDLPAFVAARRSIGGFCPADFNSDGGVTGDDVVAFFDDWENARPGADVNADSGITNDDVMYFFAVWEAGGC